MSTTWRGATPNDDKELERWMNDVISYLQDMIRVGPRCAGRERELLNKAYTLKYLIKEATDG